MGGWFRKVLVFAILLLGLGIPLGYWVKGKIARAESRKPLESSPSLPFPPPMEVKVSSLSLDPLPSKGAAQPSPAPASLDLAFAGKAWKSLPPGCLTLELTGPGGSSRVLSVVAKTLRVPNLPAGAWTLRLLPSPPGKESSPLWRGRTRLSPGERKSLAIPAPPLASLEGKVVLVGKGGEKAPSGPGGLQVRVYTEGGVKTTRTRDDGSFSLEGLLPGPALLMVAEGPSSGLGGTCQEILLKGGTCSRVTLNLRR